MLDLEQNLKLKKDQEALKHLEAKAGDTKLPENLDLNTTREGFGAISEGLTGVERVIEVASEQVNEQGSTGKAQATVQASQKDEDMADIKLKLKESKPPKKNMIHEIEAVLKKEERVLNKQKRKYIKSQAYKALNQVFARLREIKRILKELADATYEYIKNMWLKLVHNIG
jgi:hypothetical protein